MSPPTSVGVRDFRLHLSDWLKRVEKGESVEVTSHGKPVARLVPTVPDKHPLADLIAAGKLRPATRSTKDLKMPKPFKGKLKMSLSEALEKTREDTL